MMLARSATPVLAIGVLLAIPFSAYWSWRFLAADRALQAGTWDAVRSASALAPDLATPWFYMSELRPETSPTALPEALRRNPYHTAASTQLALWQELHGQADAAEKTLLAAAQHDRTYQTTWALLNFYFRQNREEEFWRYAKIAAQFEFADLGSVLDLCWQRRPDDLWLLDNVVPNKQWALRIYVSFLRNHDQAAAVLPVVQRMFGAPPVHVDQAVQSVQWLWEHGRPEDAAVIWTQLSDHHLLPVVKPPAPEILTNGRFTGEFGKGFDWQLQSGAGISAATTSAGLRINAEEPPAQHNLAWQPVLLRPGSRYRLQWEWRAEDEAVSPQGLHWNIRPMHPAGDQSILQSPAFASSGGAQSWTFTAGPDPASTLFLEYHREPGMRNLSGTLYVTAVSLQPAN